MRAACASACALAIGWAIACSEAEPARPPATYADQPAAIAACMRSCDRCADLDVAASICRKGCVSFVTPPVCADDPGLVASFDACTCPCAKDPHQVPLARCRGKNDAGVGVHCDRALSGRFGDGGYGCYAAVGCEGKTYEMFCADATCTCELDNVVTSRFAFGAGSAACAGLLEDGSHERWFPLCGYPSP